MACTHAKPAWRIGEGIDFHIPRAYRTPDHYIPCGRCINCAADRRREWGVRMCHEAQTHKLNCFLTLTYDADSCPKEISLEHAQRFIKRLRKEADVPLRYFLTGEYGEKTRRPHYHAILFGADFRGGPYTFTINDQLYGNTWLESIWRNDSQHSGGICSLSEFTPATAMYVAGYVTKKLDDSDTFSIMSRFPPLGKRWLEKHLREVVRLEKTVIEGVPAPIPSRYYDWALKEGWIDEEGYSRIKAGRQAMTKPMWPKQARNREINQKAKSALKEEKL